MKKRLSPGARFGIAVASALLSILLFVAALGTALIATVRVTISKDNIRDVAVQIIQPSRKDDPDSVAATQTERVIDTFYDELSEEMGEELPVEKEEFKELIEESTVKDYIVDKTADLLSDYFAGEVTTSFESEEVLELIEENNEVIVDITGEPLSDDVAEKIATVFEENEIIQKVEAEGLAGYMESTGASLPGLSASFPSNSFLDTIVGFLTGGKVSTVRNLGDIMAALRVVTSMEYLIWGIVICLLLMAAIILVNIRQLPVGLRRCGYPLLFAGSMIVLNLLAIYVPGIWKLIPGLNIVRATLINTTFINATVFGLGAVLVIVGIVLGIILKTKRVVTAAASVLDSITESKTEEITPVAVETVVETAEEVPTEAVTEEAPVVCEETVEEPAVEETAKETVAEETTEEITEEAPAPVGE